MTAHDADEVVGRITRKREWDRRYRIVQAQPEPVRFNRFDLLDLVGSFIVIGLLIAGLIAWAAIFSVMP